MILLLAAGYSSILPQPYPPVAFSTVIVCLSIGPVYALHRRLKKVQIELDDKKFGASQKEAMERWVSEHGEP